MLHLLNVAMAQNFANFGLFYLPSLIYNSVTYLYSQHELIPYI